MKLTKFEFFDKGYAQMAVELGLISPSAFMKFIHYKVYQETLLEGHNKSTAIQITAERNNSSFSTVWRSVEYFSE